MGTVAEVLREKGTRVYVIGPRQSVLNAAKRMNEHHIGALVVVDVGGDDDPHHAHDARVVGIITERDMLTRVIAAGLEPSTTSVEQVMSSPVISCSPHSTLDEVRSIMRQRRIRHVPVAEQGEGRLLGLVSIGDVNIAQTKVMVKTIEYLEQFMYHG